MTKYAVFDEVFEVMTNTSFEKLTAQQLIDAYFNCSESDELLINLFDTEEEAVDYLDKMELLHAKRLDFYSGVVHIAYARQVEIDENNEITGCGAVSKVRIGL